MDKSGRIDPNIPYIETVYFTNYVCLGYKRYISCRSHTNRLPERKRKKETSVYKQKLHICFLFIRIPYVHEICSQFVDAIKDY